MHYSSLQTNIEWPFEKFPTSTQSQIRSEFGFNQISKRGGLKNVELNYKNVVSLICQRALEWVQR